MIYVQLEGALNAANRRGEAQADELQQLKVRVCPEPSADTLPDCLCREPIRGRSTCCAAPSMQQAARCPTRRTLSPHSSSSHPAISEPARCIRRLAVMSWSGSSRRRSRAWRSWRLRRARRSFMSSLPRFQHNSTWRVPMNVSHLDAEPGAA